MTDALFQVEDIQPAEAPSPILYKFTNAGESPWLDSLLAMFYKGAADNTIGIMDGWNVKTQEPELVLVGVQVDADGKCDLWPLATVIPAEKTSHFLAPNGKGDFYDPRNHAETQLVKDSMRPFDDSIVAAVEPTEQNDTEH